MKKNNRGFTVIELIIAISIFSIIIAIGYNLIIKYNKTVNEQQTTSSAQMFINNINKYMTKDLEKATGVTLKTIEPNNGVVYSVTNGEKGKEEYLKDSLLTIQQSNKILPTQDESKLTYQYIINTTNPSKNPIYTFELIYKKNSAFMKCSISRSIENESNIELLNNHNITKTSDKFALPLVINHNNPYNVAIDLQEESNKMNAYSFDVSSRFLMASSGEGGTIQPERPTPPNLVVPDGYDAIGFWTADQAKCETDNLYTWIAPENEYINPDPSLQNKRYLSDPGQQIVGKESFEIYANNQANGNSGHTWAKIGYKNNDWRASKNRVTTMKPKYIKEIYVYVSKNTTLSNIVDENGTIVGIEGKYNSIPSTGVVLEGGTDGTLYKCNLKEGKKNEKKSFDVSGTLSLDSENDAKKVNSGYAMILYGSEELGEFNTK